MSLSDSMFLFEVIVEELNSYIYCKEFYMSIQFADVFTLNLKDPNEFKEVFLKMSKKKRLKKRTKMNNLRTPGKKIKGEPEIKKGQSILFTKSINSLILNMKTYPMELFLWSKDNTDKRIGSTDIPWNSLYIDYLNNKIHRKCEPTPVAVSGEYNVFHEITSKRMATIKLNMKLTCLNDKILTQFQSLSEDKHNTFMDTEFHFKPGMILSTVRNHPSDVVEKTSYNSEQCNWKRLTSKFINDPDCMVMKKESVTAKDFKVCYRKLESKIRQELYDYKKTMNNFSKSLTEINESNQITVSKQKSCTSISCKNHKIINYIFGDDNASFGNKVYCVGYFTVENEFNKSKESSKASLKGNSSEQSITNSKGKYNLQICDSECPKRKTDEDSCTKSICSLYLPEEAANLIKITKCNQVDCDNKNHRKLPPPPNDRIFLDGSNIKKECCDISEKVEEIVGEMKAKMKFEGDPCYCSCECTFGFTKKTTYCTVCGGYENAGEDFACQKRLDMPFPCPIFHKLVDKNKLKTWSTSGSSAFSKKRADDSQRNLKLGAKSATSEKRSIGPDKSAESEKDGKKHEKKDDRFKFNYGYQAPQIGHSRCAFPCTGTLGVVPKNMGWLWTAENVPGMKFRPLWKPGATNKHVVRLLRIAKNPDEALAKKKRKDLSKTKKLLKRPLLIVHKKDGEFTITMETMKAYSKPRAINYPPYDEKPLLTYTIGRTEEENRERQRRKERELRRLERAQRQFVQSAFRDVCRDICLKTYEQALGLLSGTEDPNCPCFHAHPDAEKANQDVSCSCSEEKLSIGTDSDDDEWIVEFTPPSAFYDPNYKKKKVIITDNGSQYTYLDYKVKLLDRYGNTVPRYFKGPDGKQQCSDLGGFWGPDHKWLEINVDGYIAPDGRWAPNNFIGPDGEQVDTDSGKFQSTNGKWLIIGVDGYIDAQGKWKFYPKPRVGVHRKHRVTQHQLSSQPKKGTPDNKPPYKQVSEAAWSCFGDATPKQLSKMGIVGHGQDKKLLLSTLKDLLAQGEDVRLPQQSTVPHYEQSKKKGVAKLDGRSPDVYNSRAYFVERSKCRHPISSEKGVTAVDAHGNKTYIKMKDFKNKRPKERLDDLKHRGISLSAFHVPCFHSFINSEVMKREQIEKLLAMSAMNTKCVSTQIV